MSQRNKKKAARTHEKPIYTSQLAITITPKSDWGFGGADRVTDFPSMEDIPAPYKTSDNPYVQLQREWLFGGIRRSRLLHRPNVDRDAAVRHLSALQESFVVSHEHKQAAVAYLMAMWFDIAA